MGRRYTQEHQKHNKKPLINAIAPVNTLWEMDTEGCGPPRLTYTPPPAEYRTGKLDDGHDSEGKTGIASILTLYGGNTYDETVITTPCTTRT